MYRTIAALLIAVLLLAALGCAENGGAIVGKDYNFKKTMRDGYPVTEHGTTLTVWAQIKTNLGSYGNYGETEFAKYLREATGINVEYIHPPATQEDTSFTLMIASGSLPDIIGYRWGNYGNGGMAGAVLDNIAVPINGILENGGAPNLKKVLDGNPGWKKSIITDDNHIVMFPYIADEGLASYSGGMIRKDWLDSLGLDVPTTIDELEIVLRAFRGMGVKTPLSIDLQNVMSPMVNALTSGFGVGSEFYAEDGKIKYGPYEPGYKDFVGTMRKWYDEGLYDKEFAAADYSKFSALIARGDLGIAYGGNGGSWGEWLPALYAANPQARLASLPPFTAVKGQRAEFGHLEKIFQEFGSVITTRCKDVELAAKLLDYGFSEQGSMLFNFGKEGEAYVMDGTQPKYTERLRDTDKNGGVSLSQAISYYCGTGYFGAPFVQDARFMEEFYTIPEQRQNIKTWGDSNMARHLIPNLQYTAEEAREVSRLTTDLQTYKQESLYKFIAGVNRMEDYDGFLKTLESIGIQRALELQQAAYDRYLRRE
jgi:putative aldouronate transport system substrate-binding protein